MNAVVVDNRTTITSLPEGYTIRPSTMGDLEAVVALINAHARATISANVTTVETQRLEWETSGLDLEADTRVVVTPDGRLAGYIQVWVPGGGQDSLCSWGRVHPDYKGMGLADCLIAWTEARASQLDPHAPESLRVALLRRDTPCARLDGTPHRLRIQAYTEQPDRWSVPVTVQ